MSGWLVSVEIWDVLSKGACVVISTTEDTSSLWVVGMPNPVPTEVVSLRGSAVLGSLTGYYEDKRGLQDDG